MEEKCSRLVIMGKQVVQLWLTAEELSALDARIAGRGEKGVVFGGYAATRAGYIRRLLKRDLLNGALERGLKAKGGRDDA